MPAKIMARKTKDPNAVLPYSFELASWLGSLAEVSATAAWGIDDPPDGSMVIDSSAVAGTVATAVVSGGTDGSTYKLRCRATTSPSGFVDDFVISIQVIAP